MPTIPLEVLDCAVYLYASPAAARAGERAGGSGFLVMVPMDGYEDKAGTFYVATNAHVVGSGFRCVRLNTAAGGHDSIEIADEDWIRHPDGDDLAVAEIELSQEFRFKAIASTSFLDGYDPAMFGVGQEVYMVARDVNHEGQTRNLPTARFGNIAQLPYEQVRTALGLRQDAFLCDMRSLGGYSGAPTFVYRSRPDLKSDPDKWVSGFEHRFLGIDSGHLPSPGRVLDEHRKPVTPPLFAEQGAGLAVVIPAWRLGQLLFEDEEVLRRREESAAAWLASQADD